MAASSVPVDCRFPPRTADRLSEACTTEPATQTPFPPSAETHGATRIGARAVEQRSGNWECAWLLVQIQKLVQVYQRMTQIHNRRAVRGVDLAYFAQRPRRRRLRLHSRPQ